MTYIDEIFNPIFDRLLAGCPEAFETLCEFAQTTAQLHASRKRRARHLAEDMAADGVLRGIEVLRALQETGDRTRANISYLGTCIRKAVDGAPTRSRLIKQPRKSRNPVPVECESYDAEPSLTQYLLIAGGERLFALWEELLASCDNPRERRIVELRAEGYSDAEIAAREGCDATTIGRTRKRIQERVSRAQIV